MIVFFSGSKTKETDHSEQSIEIQSYIEELEKKLEKQISSLSSVESCDIMLTVSQIKENEFLENSKESANETQYSREKEYLIVSENGNDTVIIKSKSLPKISGVMVIYKGKSDVETTNQIIQAVSTVLGIQSNRVCVIANKE